MTPGSDHFDHGGDQLAIAQPRMLADIKAELRHRGDRSRGCVFGSEPS
jgi:hypothetical protein